MMYSYIYKDPHYIGHIDVSKLCEGVRDQRRAAKYEQYKGKEVGEKGERKFRGRFRRLRIRCGGF